MVTRRSAPLLQKSPEMARRCRVAGASVPATDLLIAACARVHGLELLHRDARFERIEAAG